jgi:hypothetical protein
MSVTAGALSQISVSSTGDVLQSAVATGGTGPYTYQWYRQTSSSSITPGGGNIVAGATSLLLSDSGLTPGSVYYYCVVATDTGASDATSQSATLTVTTLAPSLSQNQFSQSPFIGMVDQAFNYNTLACQVDAAIGAGVLSPGQAVKWATTAGGLPKIVPSTASTDNVAGFVNFSIKDASFAAGQPLSISMAGNCIYLYAALAINRGQFLSSLPAGVAGGCNGGVIPAASSDTIIGYALDSVAIGQLCRVMLMTPSNQVN